MQAIPRNPTLPDNGVGRISSFGMLEQLPAIAWCGNREVVDSVKGVGETARPLLMTEIVPRINPWFPVRVQSKYMPDRSPT